jgi:hypothetical protein
MRCVGRRGSLLAGVSAAAILSYWPHAALAEDTAALSPEAGRAAPSTDDYYARRAKQTLEAEKRAAVRPHPLAARYPGMDVVVCEAGCPTGRGAQVVAVRKPDRTAVKSEGFMVATSASAAPGLDRMEAASGVACIAGCYGTAENRPLPRARPAPRVERMTLPPRDKLSPVR